MLQERLRDLDHVSPNSWLDDTLWLALAYHTWRAPLIVNSNWWLLFKNDPGNPDPPCAPGATNDTPVPLVADPKNTLAAGQQGGGEEWIRSHTDRKDYYYQDNFDDVVKPTWVTDWQVRRASWLVHRFAQFRTRVAREEEPAAVTRAGPSCMHQYKLLFNISRIPLPHSDSFSVQDNHAPHVTVMIDDFIYSVDVFAPRKGDEPAEPLPPAEIERLLQAAVADAKARKDGGEKPALVGILTADERDTWTLNRERVLLHSPKNRETFNAIDRSLIALCLDTYTMPTLPTQDPLRQAPVDAQMRNAQAGIFGGRNRWFDKALTVIVENNGRAAVMGEHSPVDALIPSFVVDSALEVPVDNSAYPSTKGAAPALGDGFKREDFEIDQVTVDEITACTQRNKAIVADSDAATLWWAEYATDWMKKVAKQAPDAYIQQVLQLAWFRDQGYASATYETASTRQFKHGRTDVIRTLSPESREFVKSMDNAALDDKARYDLLTKACNTHSALTKSSSNGDGFDRHLMGLKVQLRPGESHPIFEDDLYAKSQEWKLSTSGLSSGLQFYATGFGAAWPDGYGINYMAGPKLIKFGLESKVSCDTTSTERFKHRIAQAFRDLRRVCEAQPPTEQAKL